MKLKATLQIVAAVAVASSAVFSGCSEKQKPAEQVKVVTVRAVTNAAPNMDKLDLKGLAKQAAIYGWWCASERGMTLEEMLTDMTNREAQVGLTNTSR